MTSTDPISKKKTNPLLSINLKKKPKLLEKMRKQNEKTSDNSPIFVDWLLKSDNSIKFKYDLGMTLCPGKHQEYSQTGVCWKRNIDKDLKRLKEYYGITTIVTLLTKEEMKQLNVSNLLDKIISFNINSVWYSIQDTTIPNNSKLWIEKVKLICNKLLNNKNEKVLIHCMGGLNRTGMFVLSVLKYLNLFDNIYTAVKYIQKSRKNSGGNPRQIQFVQNLTF